MEREQRNLSGGEAPKDRPTVSACDGTRAVVPRPAAERQTTTQSPGPPRSATQPLPATTVPHEAPRIDGYRVLSLLGVGGMGIVWRAVQLSTRREVALKILVGGTAGSERARRRFEREVELTSRLVHPHIARVYDSGVHQGVYYFAMELVEGPPMDVYVRSAALSRRDVLTLHRDVCRAVQYAHQRGVIHRDLKPSNVLVDSMGKPRVLDFGLAKLFSNDGVGPGASLDGEVAGTPAFMSPEQASGRPDCLDVRTDVYSLGVVLYLLLTGRYPHDVAGSQWEILRRISEDEIIRPRSARPDLDSELEAILLKALARSPDARYAGPGALADDIDSYLEGEPVTARPATLAYFARKRLRKHWVPVSASATGLVILFVMAVWSTVRIADERDRARHAATQEAALRAVAELRLAERLVAWGDSLASDGRLREAREQYEEAQQIYLRSATSPLLARLALWQATSRLPAPLWAGPVAVPAATAASFLDADGVTAYALDDDGSFVAWDLARGSRRRVLPAPDRLLADAAPGRWRPCLLAAPTENPLEIVWYFSDAGTQAGRGPVVERVEASSGKVVRRARMTGALNVRPVAAANGRCVVYGTDRSALSGAAAVEDDPQVLVVCDLSPRPHDDEKTDAAEAAPVQLIGDVGIVGALVIARDGTRMLSGDSRGRLQVWDLVAGVEVGKAETRVPGINALAWSEASGTVAIGGSDGSLGIWSVDTGYRIRELPAHQGAIRCLAFSPDGGSLLAGDQTGVARLWDPRTGVALRAYYGHSSPIEHVAFSGDGRRCLTAAVGEPVRVWPAATTIEDPPASPRLPAAITSFALSPDGRTLACGLETGVVALLKRSDPSAAASTVGRPSEAIRNLTWQRDGQVVRVGHRDGQWEDIDAQTGASILAMGRAAANAWDCGISSDGRAGLLAAGRSLTVSDLPSGGTRELPAGGPLLRCGLSGDGSLAWGLDAPGRVRVFDTRTAAELLRYPEARFAEFSPDGRLVIIGGVDGQLNVLEPRSGRAFATLIWHRRAVTCATWSADGQFVISGDADGNLILWSVRERRLLRTLPRQNGSVAGILFSKQYDLIAVRCDRAKTVTLLELSEPAPQ